MMEGGARKRAVLEAPQEVGVGHLSPLAGISPQKQKPQGTNPWGFDSGKETTRKQVLGQGLSSLADRPDG
jgi:hypothetical protein